MEKTLQIIYTSDTHGYLYPTLYAERTEAPMGLMKLMDAFPHGKNTLILDGGDTLQGSPLTNLYSRMVPEDRASCLSSNAYGEHPIAAVMNLAGYRFITLGNHDFNYGLEALGDYLQNLDALCLCANIRDKAHALPIAPYAIMEMENGLRVGIAGVCTHYVARWENPEISKDLEIEDAFEAAARVLEEIRPQCDLTVLIYHGGYERDLANGRLLSRTSENQACRICKELHYDLVLTGHQHMHIPGLLYGNSYTLQLTYRAAHACLVSVSVDDTGAKRFDSRIIEPTEHANAEAAALLEPLQQRVNTWLDTPAGRLSLPLRCQDHLDSALYGCPLANFVNQVQMWLSGAQVSTCALPNEYKGLPKNVTIRDVVSTYIYSNTLLVLEMDWDTLKQYIERSACYFALEEGKVILGETFTRPKVQHYNYDFFSGVDYVIDVSRPVGQRVTSIRLNGRELQAEDKVSICVNSYRRGGTSGYDMVSAAPVLREVQTDVADAIIEYISTHPAIQVDLHRWTTILPET